MARHPHEIADRRSLALHEQIGQRLLGDPRIVERARQLVGAWRVAQNVSPLYVEAWGRVLELPLQDIARMLGEASEMANMLRQVSPFLHVLSPRERWSVLRNERSTRETQ